jgi:hypothetical protein
MCILGRHVVFIIVCVLFVVGWRRRVECVYYPCTHAHTQKKKKKNCTCYKRFSRHNEEVRYINSNKIVEASGIQLILTWPPLFLVIVKHKAYKGKEIS